MSRSTRFVEGTFPFLPLVYVAWADSELSSQEIRFIHSNISSAPGLSSEARAQLASWLDPQSPPDAHELVSLLGAIADLGQTENVGSVDRFSEMAAMLANGSPEAVEALADIERATGLNPELLIRDLTSTPDSRPIGRVDQEMASELDRMLNSRWKSVRELVFRTLDQPVFGIPTPEDTATYRELTLQRVRKLADEGLGLIAYPEHVGGKADLDSAIGAFEALALGDLSVLVKFGVQFGLFGGSVLQLGTRRHHDEHLRAVGTLELPGCFAMTERDHGSNVRDLETTAVFDKDAGEFTVHTPHDGAAKEWIGNAACHGQMATVFARLIIHGDDFGIHAFLVPIRDAQGKCLSNVRIEDMGQKVGLNGVDNGRIWFDNVRIPITALLDRYAQVSSEGKYSASVRSRSARFFQMIGTLVTGRISVARAALSTAKKALKTAVTYSEHRRQFGPAGEPEIPVLDYPTQQQRLLPRVAASYCLHFALDHLCDLAKSPRAEDSEKVETIAAALKAYTTQFNLETIQASRESCGGNGYSADMGFGTLRSDTDVFTTFEGDNTVLYQLVARGLLSEFKERFGDLSLRSALRLVSRRAATTVTKLNPVAIRNTSPEHLASTDFLLATLEFRSQRLLHSVARRIRSRLQSDTPPFQAFLDTQDHLIHLARAFAEHLILERAVVRGIAFGAPVVDKVIALFGIDCIYRDRAWFLESGVVETNKSRAIRSMRITLCNELRPHALTLVEGFGIPAALSPGAPAL